MNDQLNGITDPNGCPACGSSDVTPIRYTWWGGVLGPKLLHHTKCNACKHRYNSKTRGSNTTAIVIYSVVLFVLVFGIMFYAKSR